MIHLNQALDIVCLAAKQLGTETVELFHSISRVLAADVLFDTDSPAFDKSAVDGYACKLADVSQPMQIIETIAAGQVPSQTIGNGKCSRIMTGAMLPEGAECVIMVEDTVYEDNTIRFTGKNSKGNIRFKGEEAKKGDVLLASGTLLKMQHLAILASVGCVLPLVYKQARVGVISTGDELVEPQFTPQGAQLRNSNATQLMAQLMQMGNPCTYFGIANDNKPHLIEKMSLALEQNDVLILSGGVSMGDYDFVPEVLNELGFTIEIEKVNVKPGKPLIFAQNGQKWCFGLPGNPVSSLVQFELMVKPFLFHIQQHSFKPLIVGLPLAENFTAKGGSRLRFVPVNVHENLVKPLFYKGSGHIGAFTTAQGLMEIPIGKENLLKGEMVYVRLL